MRGADDALELYLSGDRLAEMRRPNRTFFEGMPTGFPVLDCAEVPRSGIHLDYRTQTAGVWTIDALEGFLDDPRADWPGWHWEFWGGDIHQQLAGCGGRLTVPPLPAHLRALDAFGL